jgi:hypothetical protein
MSDPRPPEMQRLIGRVVRLAEAGFPFAASRMAIRYQIEFGPDTLRRWRASQGKLVTLAWLLTEHRPNRYGTGKVLAKDRRREHRSAHGQPSRAGQGRASRRRQGAGRKSAASR